MRKLLGTTLILLTLLLVPLGLRHLFFLEITKALSQVGTFAYADEGLSRIRVLDYRGKNFKFRELNFLIIPAFPRLFISVVGKDGEILLEEGKGTSHIKIPPLLRFAELKKINVKASSGDFILLSQASTLRYTEGRLELRSEKARVSWKGVKLEGTLFLLLSGDGKIKDAEFKARGLRLRAKGKGPVLSFSFSADPGKIVPWMAGKLGGRGKIREGILEIYGEGRNLRIYKGRLSKVSFQLRKGKVLSWRLATPEGDLILGKGEKFRVASLRWRPVAEAMGFPLKPNLSLHGEGRWKGRTLKLALSQKGGGKIVLDYGRNTFYISTSNLSFEKHLLNFEYKQKESKAGLKINAFTKDASLFIKEAGRVYKYFVGDELFQPPIEGTAYLHLNYRFLGKQYRGTGEFFLQKGKAYNYFLKNLRVRWEDSHRDFKVEGGFRWSRGEGSFRGEGPGEKLKISFSGWAMMEDLLRAAEVETEITGRIKTKGKLRLKGEIPVIEGVAEMNQGRVFGLFPFSGKGNYTLEGEDFNADFYGEIYKGIFRGKLRSRPGNSHLKISVEGFQVQDLSESLTGTGFASIISQSRGEEVNTTLSLRVEKFGYPEDEKGNLVLTGSYYISPEEEQRVFASASLQGKALCKMKLEGKGKDVVQGTMSGSCPRAGELLPWAGSQMELNINGHFSWKKKDFNYNLKIEGKGPVLTLLSYPQPVENFALAAEAHGRKLNFKIIQGSLGGGKVKGEGRVEFSSPLKIDSVFTLKNCELYPFRGVEAKGSANLYVRSKGERIDIGGGLILDSGKWEREFEQPLEFSSRPAGPLPSWINRIFLRLNITSKEGIRLKNSWGNLTLFPDVTLVGPVAEPMMSGIVTLSEGFIWVSERRFTVKEGKVYLSPGLEFDPYIDVEAEALIKHYRVNMKIQGLLSHLHVSLSSSPPLPTHELFSLLALGESFRRGISKGFSAQITSSSLISQVLSTRIGKRARSFLGLSRLSISPNLVRGTSLTSARLTAEKRVGEKLTVVYSTDLSGSKKGIIILEYKINPNVSLVLTKDETDNYILDIIYYPSIR